MSEDCELAVREAFEQVTTAGLVAVGEVAKQLPDVAAHPELQALLSVALPIFGFAIGRRLHHAYAARLPRFTRGYAGAFGGDQAKVKQHAEICENDATYHETMYRAFRAMLDAADPEVVEALGYLAGTYTLTGKKPDAFFRGLGRALCDLEASEFCDLKALLVALQNANRSLEIPETWLDVVIDTRELEESERVVSRQGPITQTIVDLEVDVRIVLSSDTFLGVGNHPAAQRLFILLKREGLAENHSFSESPKRERQFPTGDLAMFISDDTVRDILAIVAPNCTSE
jgi:hypothetical protein